MKIGFLGMGNMGTALASGFLRSGRLAKEEVGAFAPHAVKLNRNAQKIGFTPYPSPEELADASDTVIIACKPYQIEALLERIGSRLGGKAIVSIAAGWPYARYRAILPSDARVRCVMPNTPAMIGEGVLLFEETHDLKPEEDAEIRSLFGTLGTIEVLPTHLMGIAETVSGCGPAYMDMIMEAYADAAVKYGLPRDTAYRLVAQTMRGSAGLQAATGKHPGVLKDEVCSPAGYTIRGVEALEQKGLRAAILAAVEAVMSMRA